MSEEPLVRYKALGPWSELASPEVNVTVPPLDLDPLLQALARVEVAVQHPFEVETPAPIVHVAAPVINIEQRPQDAPVIEVHMPEPIVNITVPEVIIPPQAITVEGPHVEVHVALPGLKGLLIANAVCLAILAGTVVFAALALI